MQNYIVNLQSKIINPSYLVQRAANSLDIDINEKLTHKLSINASIDSDYQIGLIIGASGSGKTTLAREIFKKISDIHINPNLPLIDQFPSNMSYEDIAMALNGVGLTSVPCWIAPFNTLSNGQKSRAQIALALCLSDETIIIDEFTSVVDRTTAKVMSLNINKAIKRGGRRIVLISCHYDVLEWLDPCWVIDCNKQKFVDRRLLRPDERERKERFKFEFKQCDPKSWRLFSKYHYLNSSPPRGFSICFGVFYEQRQIGFQAFSNYVPTKNIHEKHILHSNRTVVHPDFVGLGLGLKMVNIGAAILYENGFHDIRAKLSSVPMIKARNKSENWKLINQVLDLKRQRLPSGYGFKRSKVKCCIFKYIHTSNLLSS